LTFFLAAVNAESNRCTSARSSSVTGWVGTLDLRPHFGGIDDATIEALAADLLMTVE
jgi:hypothetical protein